MTNIVHINRKNDIYCEWKFTNNKEEHKNKTNKL